MFSLFWRILGSETLLEGAPWIKGFLLKDSDCLLAWSSRGFAVFITTAALETVRVFVVAPVDLSLL